jgi:hypothetical protein
MAMNGLGAVTERSAGVIKALRKTRFFIPQELNYRKISPLQDARNYDMDLVKTQDEPMEVGEVGSKRPSSGCNGVHVCLVDWADFSVVALGPVGALTNSVSGVLRKLAVLPATEGKPESGHHPCWPLRPSVHGLRILSSSSSFSKSATLLSEIFFWSADWSLRN